MNELEEACRQRANDASIDVRTSYFAGCLRRGLSPIHELQDLTRLQPEQIRIRSEAVGVAPAADPGFLQRYGATIEYILIPGAALVGALAIFGLFVALFGKNPLDLYFYMYQGAFGTWFSWQNTLTRAAPLILTALCTALPAQLGMVIIGGEGALLIGALSATSVRAGDAVGLAAGGANRDGVRRRDRRRSLDHARGRACGNIAASTRRSRACCWSISGSRSSTIWSRARCAIPPASTSRRPARSAPPT